jgi:flagellar M-ring protein FliF
VDSIESARVMVVMPENRLLVDGNKRPTASVFVRARGNANLPSQTVNAIRFLVANAVEGLQPNYVTVVDNLGNTLSENTENDSILGATTSQLAARRNLETYLAKKVEEMLDRVLGPGQAVARVSADINYDVVSKTEEKFDPDGTVLKSSSINDENTDSTTANSSGGAPGATTDASTETNAAAGPLNKNNTRKKVTTSSYEVSKTLNTLTQTPGGIKRLSAAVFVAERASGTGTNRVVTPRSDKQRESLRQIVRSALGIQDGAAGTRGDEITLEETEFNDQSVSELTQQLDKDQKRQFWTTLLGNLVYPALAIGMLAVFWRLFKKTPDENIPVGVSIGELMGANGNGNGNGHAHANGNGNGHGHGNGNGGGFQIKPRSGVPGVVTVDVLNQLIREHPDNMTQAIRGWMTRGKTK